MEEEDAVANAVDDVVPGADDVELHVQLISGEKITSLSAQLAWTMVRVKDEAGKFLEQGLCIRELLLADRRLADSETVQGLGVVGSMVLQAIVSQEFTMNEAGQPILGFLAQDLRAWLIDAVAEEIGEHARDLSVWSVSAAASTADDQPFLGRDFKHEFSNKGPDADAFVSPVHAHLFIFRTQQGYIAGAFRCGFTDADEQAFVFSLVRPEGHGERGLPFEPGQTTLCKEPVKLKVRPECSNRAIYRGGGALFCFGAGSTGEEDFGFNHLSPFVSSNLQRFGPEGTDPVLLFGGGERATNGNRFAYMPDIMLAYRIPLAIA